MAHAHAAHPHLTALALVALVAASLLTADARAQVNYSFTELGTLGGSDSRAFDINEHGQIVGYSHTETQGVHAFLWEDGEMTDLGAWRAFDINDPGTVVGDQNGQPVVWQNGQLSSLPTYEPHGSMATDINDAGVICGWSQDDEGPFSTTTHPVVWVDGAIVQLGRVDDAEAGRPVAINDHGHLAGRMEIDGFAHAAAWLPDPVLLPGGGTIRDINNLDQIVGHRQDLGPIVFMGNDEPTPLPGEWYYSAYAINDHGVVVGTGDGGQLWVGGVRTGLAQFVDDGFDITIPHAINDAGVIVGYGTNADGDIRAFMMTPVVDDITFTAPANDEIVMPGEPYTIAFDAPQSESVDLFLVTVSDPGGPRQPLATGISADAGTFEWDVPANMLTPATYIVAVDADDPEKTGHSDRFRVRDPWWLHRVVGPVAEPAYEPFDLATHCWGFSQDTVNMWPATYWGQPRNAYTDLTLGVDPAYDDPAVRYHPDAFSAQRSDHFMPWVAWTRAFGNAQVYRSMDPIAFDRDGVEGVANRPNPAAWRQWTGWRGVYNGACYGAALSVLAAFQDPERFDAEWLPGGGSQTLGAQPTEDEARDAIAGAFCYQFGLAESRKAWRDIDELGRSPRETLDEVKRMLERDVRDLDAALWFDVNPGAHTVVPYGLTRIGESAMLEVLIYDPNEGPVPNLHVTVDSLGNTWSYDGPRWSASGIGEGIYTTVEAIDLFQRATGQWQNVFQERSGDADPRSPGEMPTLDVFVHGDETALSSDAGEIRYADGKTTQTKPRGVPVYARSGLPSPPLAYRVPTGVYTCEVTPLGGETRVRADWGERQYGFGRRSVGGEQVDRAVLDPANGMTVTTGGAGSLDAEVLVLVGQAYHSLAARGIAQPAMADLSLRATADAAAFHLTGPDVAVTYDLFVDTASPSADRRFAHRGVPLPAGATHVVRPDWSSLGDSLLVVDVDLDGDGMIDETMSLENDLPTTPIEPWSPATAPTPTRFLLSHARPNPFGATAELALAIPRAGHVRVELFDTLGRRVARLHEGTVPEGTYRVRLDGRALANGVYHVRAVTAAGTAVRRVTVVR